MSLLDRSLNTGGIFVLGMGSVLVIGAAFPTQLSGVRARIAAAASPIACSSTGTASCLNVTNTSSGVAVYGTSKSGTGLRGLSTSNNGLKATSSASYGVYGQWSTGPAAVYGTMSNKIGVLGADTGNGVGVQGTAAGTGSDTRYGFGVGVQGIGLNQGTGVGGTSNGGGVGVEGAVVSESGDSTGTGVEALSEDGAALKAEAENKGDGAELGAVSGTALVANASSGNGADITGKYDAIVGHSDGVPLLLTNASDGNVFLVDGKGAVSYHGTLHSFVRTQGGESATSFGSKSTAPTLEDTGTGHLVNGSAAVPLDRIFASSIDATGAYRVFVTPDGDSRGLFVASKTVRGFIVRESQGGRSTMDFDYRVVALPIGHASERMALAPKSEPRAPMAKTIRLSLRNLRGVPVVRP